MAASKCLAINGDYIQTIFVVDALKTFGLTLKADLESSWFDRPLQRNFPIANQIRTDIRVSRHGSESEPLLEDHSDRSQFELAGVVSKFIHESVRLSEKSNTCRSTVHFSWAIPFSGKRDGDPEAEMVSLVSSLEPIDARPGGASTYAAHASKLASLRGIFVSLPHR